MSNLLPDLGYVQIRSGEDFPTCKRQASRNQPRKKKRANQAEHNEFGEQYDIRTRAGT